MTATYNPLREYILGNQPPYTSQKSLKIFLTPQEIANQKEEEERILKKTKFVETLAKMCRGK